MTRKYIVEVIAEDHPMYGDYTYSVKRLDNGYYCGKGRFCREAEDVYKYLLDEEREALTEK